MFDLLVLFVQLKKTSKLLIKKERKLLIKSTYICNVCNTVPWSRVNPAKTSCVETVPMLFLRKSHSSVFFSVTGSMLSDCTFFITYNNSIIIPDASWRQCF